MSLINIIITNRPYKKDWFAINNYLSDFVWEWKKKYNFNVSIYSNICLGVQWKIKIFYFFIIIICIIIICDQSNWSALSSKKIHKESWLLL